MEINNLYANFGFAFAFAVAKAASHEYGKYSTGCNLLQYSSCQSVVEAPGTTTDPAHASKLIPHLPLRTFSPVAANKLPQNREQNMMMFDLPIFYKAAHIQHLHPAPLA